MMDTIGLFFPPSITGVTGLRRNAYGMRNRLHKEKRFRTLQIDWTNDSSFYFSISVPSMLYGSSLYEYSPSDAEALKYGLWELVDAFKIRIDSLDDVSLNRLDCCRNLRVGRRAADFIIQLGKYRPPRALPIRYGDGSIVFKFSDHRSLSFYDKLRQLHQKRNGDLLRIEYQLKDAATVTKFAGISTLGELFRTGAEDSQTILWNSVKRVIGDQAPYRSFDTQAIWEESLDILARGNTPVFVAMLLSQLVELTPEDVTGMTSEVKRRVSPKTYHRFMNRLLKPVSVGNMDRELREAVLDRIVGKGMAN